MKVQEKLLHLQESWYDRQLVGSQEGQGRFVLFPW